MKLLQSDYYSYRKLLGIQKSPLVNRLFFQDSFKKHKL
jgi:hypothetical protein